MSSDDQENVSTDLRKPDSPEANVGNPSAEPSGTSKADEKRMISCHKFNTAGHTASWFFENCSRELAEKIVSECPHMGNTLMRTNSNLSKECAYVITMRQESPKKIVHHLVRNAGEGFKVILPTDKYLSETLDEVMDTFVRETGPSITHPMKSNDLKELGVEFDAMNSKRDG